MKSEMQIWYTVFLLTGADRRTAIIDYLMDFDNEFVHHVYECHLVS